MTTLTIANDDALAALHNFVEGNMEVLEDNDEPTDLHDAFFEDITWPDACPATITIPPNLVDFVRRMIDDTLHSDDETSANDFVLTD